VAYDVTERRRLQRVHRYLRRKALPVQHSVFFLHGTDASVKATMNEVAEIIHIRRDDVRAYPIEHPSRVWLSGASVVDGPLLRLPAAGARPARRREPTSVGVTGLIARLWRKGDER
jgi:CRISPR-associated endonuclease Cas2